ncbi:MAG: hypothetical protein E7348_04405 [Clostridiales bacterium]|nr:hypothetical protein [Clostridiales bacterium]
MFLYNYDNLKAITQTENGKKLISEVEKIYNKYFKNEPIPTTDYSLQKLIYKTGNRDLHQRIYYLRRKRFSLLQLLALANDDYLEDFENILAVILEEYTWVLPAHNIQKDNTFDYTVIDLFSAETGYYLAETLHVFENKLSPNIKKMIRTELKKRIIDNYENRDQLWYDIHNNWAAVCAGSVGITYMYAFPERFDSVKDRLFKTMEAYLEGTHEEGTTPEGVGYWVYGFGFFVQFFDIYNQFTGEYPEILNRTKVLNTIKYIDNACLGGNCYLPFADGGSRRTYIHPPVAYAAKRLFGDQYVLPQYSIDEEFASELAANTGKANAFRALYGMDKFGLGDKKELQTKTVYYQESQIFIHKNNKYSFAAKSGCNLEMHNHNDVGAFQIVIDGKGVIVDPGPGKYTLQYFNDPNVRYSEEVFAAGSMGHSVPIINGKYQNEGRDAKGVVLEQTENNFKFDFASAYDNVDNLIVNYVMLDSGVSVSYNYKGIDESITFRFLSFNEPKINADGSVDVGLTISSLSGLTPNVRKVNYGGHVNIVGALDCETIYAIDYTVSGKKEVEETFEFKI